MKTSTFGGRLSAVGSSAATSRKMTNVARRIRWWRRDRDGRQDSDRTAKNSHALANNRGSPLAFASQSFSLQKAMSDALSLPRPAPPHIFIVCVDSSPHSRAAIDYACARLANAAAGRLVLLSVNPEAGSLDWLRDWPALSKLPAGVTGHLHVYSSSKHSLRAREHVTAAVCLELWRCAGWFGVVFYISGSGVALLLVFFEH